jgi:hypothetical protein
MLKLLSGIQSAASVPVRRESNRSLDHGNGHVISNRNRPGRSMHTSPPRRSRRPHGSRTRRIKFPQGVPLTISCHPIPTASSRAGPHFRRSKGSPAARNSLFYVASHTTKHQTIYNA